ncbi:MAG: NAD-dependent epimerase/dehydratase family protein [Chloroflexota bacterium]
MIYSYAQCYGLRYLVFRFNNVYGDYDTDIERMERVIPLFMQRINGATPSPYSARTKFSTSPVDDCVRGVYQGIELLAGNREVNQTINLAYGQGNSLITVAEYISEVGHRDRHHHRTFTCR